MSSTTRVLLQPAYLLHQRKFKDSSLLLEVFSRDFGRLPMVARGARRRRSRLPGVLQVFTPLWLSWAGRGEVVTMTDVEMNGSAPQLLGKSFLSGFYLNELLERLVHRYDPQPTIFRLYETTLRRLSGVVNSTHKQNAVSGEPTSVSGVGNHEWALRLFEKHLLEQLGYGLVLDHVVESGQPLEQEASYWYVVGQGPVQKISARAPSLNSTSIRGSTLLGLAHETVLDAEGLTEAKKLMRVALRSLLGDRPLHSRKLFAQQSDDHTNA